MFRCSKKSKPNLFWDERLPTFAVHLHMKYPWKLQQSPMFNIYVKCDDVTLITWVKPLTEFSTSLNEYFTEWVLHWMSTSLSEYFTEWALHWISTSLNEYFTKWVLAPTFRLRLWTCNTQHLETKDFETTRRSHPVKNLFSEVLIQWSTHSVKYSLS